MNLDDPDGDKLIYELSKLSEAAYQRRRKDAAPQLGMRVDALDRIIRHARAKAEENAAALPHWNVEPWETEVGGAELRCAALRARIWQADIDAVGLALKGGLVTPDQALELLHDCDALHLVGGHHEVAR